MSADVTRITSALALTADARNQGSATGFLARRPEVAKVYRRMATLAALAAVLLMVCASPAAASQASFEPPVVDAELVSRESASGAQAVQSALTSIDSVDLNANQAVITVDDADGPHDITLDYGDLLADKSTAGAGYFAGAYVGLGVLGRLLRLVRGLFGPFGG